MIHLKYFTWSDKMTASKNHFRTSPAWTIQLISSSNLRFRIECFWAYIPIGKTIKHSWKINCQNKRTRAFLYGKYAYLIILWEECRSLKESFVSHFQTYLHNPKDIPWVSLSVKQSGNFSILEEVSWQEGNCFVILHSKN